LKPVRSKEEARERGRKGGIKSGEVRRNKKLMRETLEELMNMPLKDGKLEDVNFLDGIGKKNITVQQALLVKQIQKALNGENDSFKIINEIMNNKNEIRFK
jgi:lipopolysaccharide biosynthesis regulator YciM